MLSDGANFSDCAHHTISMMDASGILSSYKYVLIDIYRFLLYIKNRSIKMKYLGLTNGFTNNNIIFYYVVITET